MGGFAHHGNLSSIELISEEKYLKKVSSILFLQNHPGKGVILEEEEKLYEVEIYFREKILFFSRKSKEVHYEIYKSEVSNFFVYASEKCTLSFDNIDSVHTLLENVKKYSSKIYENIDSDSVEFEVKINKKTYKFVFQFADDIFYINCNEVTQLEFFEFFLSLCHSINSYLEMKSFLLTIDNDDEDISDQFRVYTFKRAGIEWK